MAKNDPVSKSDLAFSLQMLTFKNSIGPVAAMLGLSPAQVAQQAADADYFAFVLECHQAYQGAAQGWTAWKKTMRTGSATAEGAPVPPVLPPVPAVVPDAGIEARFRALIRQVKASPAYAPPLGIRLGIEATDHAEPDRATFRPDLWLEIRGGAVFIGWDWGGNRAFLDMIELHVDRGDGRGFTLLVFDTTPGFTDPEPLPSPPAKWKYRAIYRIGDTRTGQWSGDVAITVGG